MNSEKLIYIGTQNDGGYLLESQTFIDASNDSVYFISVTGTNTVLAGESSV